MREVKTPKKPLLYYYIIAMLVLLLFNLLAMPWLTEHQIREVDYNTFVTMTEQKEIGQVEIQEQSNRILFTGKDNKTIYKTAIVPDDGLVQRLLDAGISTTGEEVEQTSLLMSILGWVLPLILFIGIGQLISRNMMKKMGGLANVVVQTNINSFGKMATAAYGAYSKIEGFAFLPVTSFTMAITTYVGQNLGAGMKPRARKGAIFGIAAAAIIAELIGIATYLAAPWLVRLFSRTPEVIELGVLETRIICLFYCLLAFSHAIASVCRGAGKAFVPMSIMLGVWCVFRILYITVMMQWRHEIVYVYWAYPITWAISSVIYLFYFLLSNWQDGFDPQPEGEGHKHHHHFHLGHHK